MYDCDIFSLGFVVAACSLPFAAPTNVTDCSVNATCDTSEEFNILGLELWSSGVSLGAISLSLLFIFITFISCCWYMCQRRRLKNKPGQQLVEPGVWPTQGTPLHETSQFNNSLETDAQPDGMFGHNNNDNLTSDLQYQEVPKIDIQLEFLQQENDEDIYDDGTTVRPSQRPESVVYAETYTLHKPRGLEPTTASEPIYNNVTSCVNGDDTSQSSYYMQLMTNTPDNESNDQYTIIGQRQPKDNTEQWEPPHV